MSKAPRYVVTLFTMPARCDCGYRWELRYSNDPLLRDGHLGCPVCGAGLEVRAYGPPLGHDGAGTTPEGRG